MPSPDPAKRKAAMAKWYRRNRAKHIDRVQADRIMREGVTAGWEDRLRYAMRIAKRRYPRLFERAHDDMEQTVAVVAISYRDFGKPFSRAVQRALYRLEREIL